VEDKTVHLCATDLEVGLNYLVAEVEIKEGGTTVLDADKLASIVRESGDDVLTLETKDGTCEIKGSDSRFTMYCQEPEQFPLIPGMEGEIDLELSLTALQAGIKQTLFATAKESSRYAINGVLWEIKGKKMVLVATDGRRLARNRIPLTQVLNPDISKQKIIVPAKTMGLLERIGSHDKETVSIKLIGNQILLSCTNVVISSNLVEGSFPKYEDIIPSNYDKKLSLHTEPVLSAVRRASLLASEESKGIKLTLLNNNLVFSGKAPETGAAEVSMSVEYNGEPLNIGFNPHYLTDALRVLHNSEFDMELGQPDRPGLIKCGADFLYLIMPINLA
jgi:DNA polymerase-3 subunit beta